VQLLRAVFIGEGGAGCCCAWGAGERVRSQDRGRGALSFGSSM
jgi:hypothetical protein